MRMFAQGLPGPLVEMVLCQDDPQNYIQWRDAAQRHQRTWLKIQSFKGNYSNAQAPNCGGGQPPKSGPFGNFYWHCPVQGNQGNCQQPTRQRLPPCDPNAMDTSAAARKANTDHEKEEYCKTGQCFECGKQGHLAQLCPTKKNRQSFPTCSPPNNRSATIKEVADDKSDVDTQAYHWNLEVLA